MTLKEEAFEEEFIYPLNLWKPSNLGKYSHLKNEKKIGKSSGKIIKNEKPSFNYEIIFKDNDDLETWRISDLENPRDLKIRYQPTPFVSDEPVKYKPIWDEPIKYRPIVDTRIGFLTPYSAERVSEILANPEQNRRKEGVSFILDFFSATVGSQDRVLTDLPMGERSYTGRWYFQGNEPTCLPWTLVNACSILGVDPDPYYIAKILNIARG